MLAKKPAQNQKGGSQAGGKENQLFPSQMR